VPADIPNAGQIVTFAVPAGCSAGQVLQIPVPEPVAVPAVSAAAAYQKTNQFEALKYVPARLPVLRVTFGAVQVEQGTTFHKNKDLFLQKPPEIEFGSSLGKCTVAYFDPDAPEDPALNGPYGNWQWLVTDCTESTANGTQQMPHDGPNPPVSTHRYVFVLFQQSSSVELPQVAPKEWNFYDFVAANTSCLKPVAVNFFFCDAE
jgi:hypothetical protein